MFQFDSLGDFVAMAGHGPFVWVSYGVSLLVMIYLIVAPLLRARRQLRAIRTEPQRRRRRAPAATAEERSAGAAERG